MMSKSKIFLLVSFIFLAVNFFWLLYFEDRGNHNFNYGSFYSFTAKVIRVDKKINGYNIVVRPEGLTNFSGRILLYIPLYPQYYYGDILKVSGKVYRPEKLVGDDDHTFAYDKYLAKDDIFGTSFRPTLKKIGQEKNLTFYVYRARYYFWHNLNDYLIEPASSLAKAMFLSPQREISPELWDIFAKVGISHMISISGSHMVIIIWLVQSFLIAVGFSRKSAWWYLVIFLLFYLYLIGFISPAVRSAFMAIILLSGPFVGRNTDSIYSLVLAADILVALNPFIILYDIGFQLSFLAVLGLVYYARFFNRILIFVSEKFKYFDIWHLFLSLFFMGVITFILKPRSYE